MELTRRWFFLVVTVIVTGLWGCDDDHGNFPLPPDGTHDATNTNKNSTTEMAALGRLEIPRVKGDANSVILVRQVPVYGINYVIEYDMQKRSQRWTAFQWYDGNSGTAWNRNNWDKQTDNEWAMLNMRTYGWGDPFQPDPDLDQSVRTELEEYQNCGYQRGHICASGDRLNSMEANEQTFYLSNIMPQSSALNTGIWLDMENQLARTWNTKSFRKVLYVVKGGTIDKASQVLEPTRTGMVVPRYFFMAVLCEDSEGQYKAMGFWVEHTKQKQQGPLRNYVRNIDELEKLTDLDFFCNLPDDVERTVQSASHASIIADWHLDI